ncbi:Tetratricopeptide repeat protein [Sideroxydans lithotrophicus ES-1]|uniref:Tetratricopeptide repeat protein n=1 Tax=Sideroxydans lithotrophicus (strain ES-1) TaxID=580332 RepID=D5CSN5_SIDLE|nr:Tetratricopeptide repeat protein [Sideroxydans lithotrophicus ES-1]
MEVRLTIRSFIAMLCGLLLLSACGHVEELRSARQEQATDLNQRAQRAFQRGEYQVAARLYESALQLDVAIENVNGIAINVLNLARVNQMLGKTELAERYLDSLLDDKALHYASTQLAAAATQKSLLRLQQNDESGATKWVERAAVYCVSDCPLSGVIDNARASIALRANDADKTLHWSERAASENRNASPLEYANSLRLSASAKLMKNEHDAALKLLEESLGIDKSLGLPEKIRQDLLLSAQVYEKMGQAERAAEYHDRAARIAAASGS